MSLIRRILSRKEIKTNSNPSMLEVLQFAYFDNPEIFINLFANIETWDPSTDLTSPHNNPLLAYLLLTEKGIIDGFETIFNRT